VQTALGGPRASLGLSEGDIDALIHDGDLEVDYEVTVCDVNDNPVQDITADVDDGAVSWTGGADLQRSVDLTISRDLAWDFDRVRPTLLLTSPLLGIRDVPFHLGVFLLTRPKLIVNDAVYLVDPTRSAQAAQCKGWDKLRLLRTPMARSWSTLWSESGQTSTVGAEARRLLAAAGWTGGISIDPRADAVELTEPYVWPLDGQGTSWLRALIDIVKAGGMDSPWVNEVGSLIIEPLRPTAERATEWVLDAGDALRTIVSPQRARSQDFSEQPNAWYFMAQNWPRPVVEGDGLYYPPKNTSSGPASIAARRREVWNASPMLDAATQEALVAQGDAAREADMRALAVRDISVYALPLLGHRDLFEVRDPEFGAPVRALATAWRQPLRPSPGQSETTITVEEEVA